MCAPDGPTPNRLRMHTAKNTPPFRLPFFRQTRLGHVADTEMHRQYSFEQESLADLREAAHCVVNVAETDRSPR